VSHTWSSVLTLLHRAGTNGHGVALALQRTATRCTASGARCIYLPPLQSLATSAISTFAASLIADGVRENLGAGAGCVTP
jgi:hypothetical protein